MEATLTAIKRDTRGKNEARRLRASGQLPAVLYGGGSREAVALSVDPAALRRILHSDAGVNTLIRLEIEGEGPAQVLVKEYLLDPVRHALLHADFYRVAMDQVIKVTVPIVLKGEARGVKQQGGVLDFVNREIEIECLPGDIPEHVDIDVSAKWKPVGDPELMLVHLVQTRVVEEPTAAAAEAVPATAEPEVIKKGKAEKAEGAE